MYVWGSKRIFSWTFLIVDKIVFFLWVIRRMQITLFTKSNLAQRDDVGINENQFTVRDFFISDHVHSPTLLLMKQLHQFLFFSNWINSHYKTFKESESISVKESGRNASSTSALRKADWWMLSPKQTPKRLQILLATYFLKDACVCLFEGTHSCRVNQKVHGWVWQSQGPEPHV